MKLLHYYILSSAGAKIHGALCHLTFVMFYQLQCLKELLSVLTYQIFLKERLSDNKANSYFIIRAKC